MNKWEHIFLIDSSRAMSGVHAKDTILNCIQAIVNMCVMRQGYSNQFVISLYSYNENVSCLMDKVRVVEYIEDYFDRVDSYENIEEIIENYRYYIIA